MKIAEDEDVVMAWAEKASGPGWSNIPVWVLIRQDFTGRLRIECLQPDEHPPEVVALREVSSVVSTAMTRACARRLKP